MTKPTALVFEQAHSDACSHCGFLVGHAPGSFCWAEFRPRPRFEFSHRDGDTLYWLSCDSLSGDSTHDQVRCDRRWFWGQR